MIDPAAPDFTRTPVADGRPSFGYVPKSDDAAPVVSIVTPFFETDRQIFSETLESVRRQSLQQWEWIIVDDGSRGSASSELLSEVDRSDSRIKVVRHEANRGLPAARNTGVAEATAPYVLFLDDDDLLEPTAIEKWVWFLESNPQYALTNGFSIGFGAKEYLWDRGFHDGSACLNENYVDGTCLVRRAVHLEVGGHDESLVTGLEDWDFWLRCAAAGYWGATIPEYLKWYRCKPEHAARWTNESGSRRAEIRSTWRRRYSQLWKGGFPSPKPVIRSAAEIDLEKLPFENKLAKEKPRLLLVAPWTAMGGSDRFNLNLIGQLERLGWQTTIVTTLHGGNAWLPEFARLTPDVFPLSHFLAPEDYPRFLRYIIESRDPNAILITNSLFAYEALPYLRTIANGRPILDYCHSVQEQWLDGGYPRQSVQNRELLDLHITSSSNLKDWMVERRVDADRVETCYINVDSEALTECGSRAELGLPENVPIIVYPGRMAEEKQPPVFAKTMLELERRGCAFLALAIGDGPYLPWLRRFIRRNRLGDRVRCLGNKANAYVRATVAAADLVFIPSVYEGISLAFYEALAAGVPVVGADVGGQRELVTPDCGVLVERADPDTEIQRYADVLEGLLRNPDRRRAMGAAGQARVRARFTLDEMGDRMHALLRQASDFAAATPGPVPSSEEARLSAIAAIRSVKLTVPSSGTWLSTRSPHLRDRLFRFLRWLGMPLYALGMRMGMHWLDPLKDRVFDALYPRAD